MDRLLIISIVIFGIFGKFSLCQRAWNAEDQRLVLGAYRNATIRNLFQEAHERQLYDLGIVLEPQDVGASNLNNFGQPITPSVRDALRASRILRTTSQYLHMAFYKNVTKQDLSVQDFYTWLFDMSRYIPPIADTARWRIQCDPQIPYRAIDGACNNIDSPNAGRAITTFGRILTPAYDYDIDLVPKGSDYRPLPLVRNLVVYFFLNSSIYHVYPEKLDYDHIPNMASLMFSQVLAHDVTQKLISLNPYANTGIQCCSRNNIRVLPKDEQHRECLPIEVSPQDPVYKKYSVGCIDQIRSETISSYGKTLSAAEQMNRATSIPDLSIVYGATQVDADSFRTFTGGRLQTSSDNILPEIANCTTNACYRIGDSRVNQTPFLAIYYSLFVRHHNRVARILATMNSFWNDEKLYQETRRILIAQYQHLIYNEFLPSFHGAAAHMPPDEHKYNPNVKPITSNEFSGAAFRVYHLFLPDQFILEDAQENFEKINLSDAVFQSTMLRTKYDAILRGYVRQRIRLEGYGDEVLHRLFKNNEGIGTDLLSTDIIRTRDHGYDGYAKYLEYFGHSHISDFDDLSDVIDYKILEKLKKSYRNVRDIDLMVGALLENNRGKLIGPTFTRIILEQFQRYRVADRFFYDRTDGDNPFTEEQLNEIKKYTFGHLFCENSGIEYVPRHAFMTPLKDSDFVLCRNLPRIKYSPWREPHTPQATSN